MKYSRKEIDLGQKEKGKKGQPTFKTYITRAGARSAGIQKLRPRDFLLT